MTREEVLSECFAKCLQTISSSFDCRGQLRLAVPWGTWPGLPVTDRGRGTVSLALPVQEFHLPRGPPAQNSAFDPAGWGKGLPPHHAYSAARIKSHPPGTG